MPVLGSPAADSSAPMAAVNWNSALHPRQYHGRFGPSGRANAPAGKPRVTAGTDPEDRQERQQAAWDRKAASALRKQAAALDRQAQGLAAAHVGSGSKARAPVSAKASAAAKKAAATKAAKGTASAAAKKAAATRASGASPAIVQHISALTSRANQLRSYANRLDKQAAQLTKSAQFARSADTVARSGARSDQLHVLDLSASPTSAAGRRANRKAGNALSDGSYPVPNADYWHRALRAKGRTSSSKWPALKRLLLKRARELGIDPSGTWVKPGKKAVSMSNASEFATPVTSSMSGPRVVVASTAAKLGLRPHQARAYAKLRKKGATHQNAYNFARRVQSKANEMGTARYANDEPDLELASTESSSNAFGTKTLLRGKQASGAMTPQKSSVLKVSAARKASGTLSTKTPPGGKLVHGYNPPKNKGAEAGKARKNTRAGLSAGRYNWPDMKGAGTVPRTPVSTGAGFKTPTNLKMKAPGLENDVGDMTSKGRNAYKKLRGAGVSHATAAKVVGQYYGAGKPKNQLGLHKGGPQTNLRIRNNGIGASRPSPKAV